MSIAQQHMTRVPEIVGSLRARGELADADLELLEGRLARGIDDFTTVYHGVVDRLGIADPEPPLDDLLAAHLDAERGYHLVFHPAEVAERAGTLAGAIGLPEPQAATLELAALVHDHCHAYRSGRPDPANETRTMRWFVDTFGPRLAAHPTVVRDVPILIGATREGADPRRVVDESPEVPGPEREHLVTLAEVISDSDLGGAASPWFDLDCRLIEMEWRVAGVRVREILRRQLAFPEQLLDRLDGVFRTAAANVLWAADALPNLERYRAAVQDRIARTISR